MKDDHSEIVDIRHLGKDYCLLKIKTQLISPACQPGNFVMIQVRNGSDPFLRRPFSILKSNPPYIWVFFQVVGHGTAIMASFTKGTSINILGPLGNQWPEFQKKNILMVAGGRGIVPLYFAGEKFAKHNKLFLVYGGKTKEDIALSREIQDLQFKKIFCYTEDGGYERKGLVTEDIAWIIKHYNINITFSCGPEAMLGALQTILKPLKTIDFASMESIMGCGFGACHGCVVETTNGDYLNVCTKGPIFKLNEIKCAI